MDETLEVCDVCESRRALEPPIVAVDSSGTSEMLLRLLKRPMDPTAGDVRSGIGGGPPIGAGLGPDGAGGVGAVSSVGLSVLDEIEDREGSLACPGCDKVGRQTF